MIKTGQGSAPNIALQPSLVAGEHLGAGGLGAGTSGVAGGRLPVGGAEGFGLDEGGAEGLGLEGTAPSHVLTAHTS